MALKINGPVNIDPKICDISYMKNGVKQKATEPKPCQAKECPKLGSLRFVLDRAGNIKWTYFLCDEHFHLLSNRDKNYIARTEGTKGE